ncbi:MAG: hypothetical protein IJY29_05855 [Ruminococcus sp.]|nr:hypothetical protein [Ruminococcus sp.]
MRKRTFAFLIFSALSLGLVICIVLFTNKPSDKKEKLPFKIKSFAFTTDYGQVYYAACLHNPNDDYYIKHPSYRVTARDGDGKVLATDDITSFYGMYPGEDVWYGGRLFTVNESPTTVDLQVLELEDRMYLSPSKVEYKDFEPLAVKNVTLVNEEHMCRLLGEVENNNDYSIDSVEIVIVFKNESGDIIAAETSTVKDVSGNSLTPFDEDMYIRFATDNYDIYAYAR